MRIVNDNTIKDDNYYIKNNPKDNPSKPLKSTIFSNLSSNKIPFSFFTWFRILK